MERPDATAPPSKKLSSFVARYRLLSCGYSISSVTSHRFDEIRALDLHSTEERSRQRGSRSPACDARVLGNEVENQIELTVAIDIFHRQVRWRDLVAYGAKAYRGRIDCSGVKGGRS